MGWKCEKLALWSALPMRHEMIRKVCYYFYAWQVEQKHFFLFFLLTLVITKLLKIKIGQEISQHAPGTELSWCVMSCKPFFKHHKNHDDNREGIIALKTSSLSSTSLLNSKQLHDMMTNFIQLKIAQFFIAIAIRLWLISYLAANSLSTSCTEQLKDFFSIYEIDSHMKINIINIFQCDSI